MGKQNLTARAAIPVAMTQSLINHLFGGFVITGYWNVVEQEGDIIVRTAWRGIRVEGVFRNLAGRNPRTGPVQLELELLTNEEYPNNLPIPPTSVIAHISVCDAYVVIDAVDKTY
jgi:hypothetical protein